MKYPLSACFLFFAFALAGQPELKLINTYDIPPRSEFFTADQFGNLYLVIDDQIIKMSEQGKRLYSYSDPLYGAISHVDALNAMNPLLFYNDVNQIRILDNRLNQTKAYNLLEAGFIDPFLLAYSDEDNVWIYDQVRDQLVRFNLRNEKTTAQSLVITQLTGSENRPKAIFSSFNRVMLFIPEEGIMLFDAQGSYIKSLPVPDSSLISFDNDIILSLGPKGALRTYYLRSQEEYYQLLPETGVKYLYLAGDKLYLMLEDKIRVYQLKQGRR